MTSDEIVAAAEALFARLDSIDTEIVMNTPNRQAGLFLIGALTLVLIVSIIAISPNRLLVRNFAPSQSEYGPSFLPKGVNVSNLAPSVEKARAIEKVPLFFLRYFDAGTGGVSAARIYHKARPVYFFRGALKLVSALFAFINKTNFHPALSLVRRSDAGIFQHDVYSDVLCFNNRLCANLVPYVGAQLPFGAGLRVFDQATGGPPQCGSEDEEQRGKSSKGDSRVSEPPIKRRLLVMLVCLMGSVGFALRAGDALYKERRALSAYWFAAALLCGLAGYGALLLNAYPATWGWWL